MFEVESPQDSLSSVAPQQEEVHQVANLDLAVFIEVGTNVVAARIVIHRGQSIVIQGLLVGATSEDCLLYTSPSPRDS